LLEANLVVEPDPVEAKPIRRKRQVLCMAGIVLSSCAAVALAVGIPMGRPDPPPAPDYELVGIGGLQEEFDAVLPRTTWDAIRQGATA
jgi:hypothetical protein